MITHRNLAKTKAKAKAKTNLSMSLQEVSFFQFQLPQFLHLATCTWLFRMYGFTTMIPETTLASWMPFLLHLPSFRQRNSAFCPRTSTSLTSKALCPCRTTHTSLIQSSLTTRTLLLYCSTRTFLSSSSLPLKQLQFAYYSTLFTCYWRNLRSENGFGRPILLRHLLLNFCLSKTWHISFSSVSVTSGTLSLLSSSTSSRWPSRSSFCSASCFSVQPFIFWLASTSKVSRIIFTSKWQNRCLHGTTQQ